MQSCPARLRPRIGYGLSPWNAEFFKPDPMRKPSERRRARGGVPVEGKQEGRYDHSLGASEPMPIN